MLIHFIAMDRPSNGHKRRTRIIHELRHQLRYAPPQDQALIRQQLDFWQRYR